MNSKNEDSCTFVVRIREGGRGREREEGREGRRVDKRMREGGRGREKKRVESRKRKGVLTVTKEKVGSKKEQQRVVHGEPHPLPEQL